MPPWLHMTGQGQRRLIDAMASFADDAARALMIRAGVSLDAPLRVTVHGLPGVGSSAVSAALTALGFEVTGQHADIEVRVVAEVVKPEDRRAVSAAAGPVLLVLTKADLSGFGPGGPVETARRRCAQVARITGTPAEPMVGLLALAALDPDVVDEPLMDALRVLVDEPGDLRTAETFVAGPHRVSAAERQRLVDALDLFGIAHAVIALRDAAPSAPVGLDAVRAVLRRVSGVDAVAARIESLGAEVRYCRLRAVIAELELAGLADSAVADFLTSDDALLAQMAAAIDVMRAAGLAIDGAGGDLAAEADAHLRRAVRWRRYGAGPVTSVHRACASDISRGSLRLWGTGR